MDILKMVVDIATIISLGIASYVALKGLNTWREETRRKYDADLARRVLRAMYRLRDALQRVRNPFVGAGEAQEALRIVRKDTPELGQDFNAQQRAVYVMRWRAVQDAQTALDAELLEMEASWGRAAKDLVMGVYPLAGRLFAAVNAYLMALDRNQRLTPERAEQDLYAGRDDDGFAKDLGVAVEKAEEFLLEKLKM